jgi:hypothetical protein
LARVLNFDFLFSIFFFSWKVEVYRSTEKRKDRLHSYCVSTSAEQVSLMWSGSEIIEKVEPLRRFYLMQYRVEPCIMYIENGTNSTPLVSKDASFFTHYYSHNVYSEKQF